MSASADSANARNLAPVSAGGSRLVGLFGRPQVIAIACIVVLAALGWLYLGLMVAGFAGTGRAAELGPGMALLDLIARPDALGRALIDALCPQFGVPASAWGIGDFSIILTMWCAMALAMMLPTAAPMIVTYAQIAETAARKGETVISPLVITAGFLVVWLGFALGASVLHVVLTRLALLDSAMASVSTLFSGGILLGAGVYQFSALKQACLAKCQRPFPFFFANWSDTRNGVFRLGLRQGIYCLGCCWAMMLVMFAVGAMNIVWMAILGMIMTLEKLSTTPRLSRAVGVMLGLAGLAFIISAVIMHWPVRAT